MKILIDTHYLLWLFFDKQQIKEDKQLLLSNPNNEIYYSSVSLWEISIKYNLGKLDLHGYSPENLYQAIQNSILKPLHIDNPLLVSFYQLPVEHKDPFDRLLIWQSIQQKMVFLSNDSNNKFYEKYGLNYLF